MSPGSILEAVNRVDTAVIVRRLQYATALHRCAEALQQAIATTAEHQRILTLALEPLRSAAGAGRAAIYRNFLDDGIFYSGMEAECCQPGIPSSLDAGHARRIPWSLVPSEHQQRLAAGLPVGGPTSRVFLGVPDLRDGLIAEGILSLQFFPIHLGTEWWGYLGFDDYAAAHEWDDEEVLFQRTAASMIAGAVQRWRAEIALRAERETRAIRAERQRLARDLHDTLTQSAYSIAIFARAATDALETTDKAKAQAALRAIEASAKEIQSRLRLLLHELQPVTGRQEALTEILEARFSQVERRLGIEAEVTGAPPDFPASTLNQLQRIAEEALNNALHHAAATRVAVRFVVTDKDLHMDIVDNGGGFDPRQRFAGLGLHSIETRAAEIGGAATITSAPGAGTTVKLSLPLG